MKMAQKDLYTLLVALAHCYFYRALTYLSMSDSEAHLITALLLAILTNRLAGLTMPTNYLSLFSDVRLCWIIRPLF